jgi:hypothetical protein
MSRRDKFVVITTIHEPSRAIELFCQWPDWKVIVVGDRKTPKSWSNSGALYLGVQEQYDFNRDLADAIPFNTYGRKILGYAYAIANGAEAIFETDDDNIPYEHACSQVDLAIADAGMSPGARLSSDINWVNIYRHFEARCWPRGFPLRLSNSDSALGREGRGEQSWSVTQFLADGDPDVDAIYRLTVSSETQFTGGKRFTLDTGCWCPFNSQATLWLPTAFRFMFLPIGISDRVTDILRGFIATASIWNSGTLVSYASPIVCQERNAHVLLRDFEDEIPLYLNAERWTNQLREQHKTCGEDFFAASIQQLIQAGQLPVQNMNAYETFLSAATLT